MPPHLGMGTRSPGRAVSAFGGVTQPEEWNDPPERWQDLAACRGLGKYGDSIFFQGGDNPRRTPAAEPNAEARSICASCAVRLECLDFALRTNQEYGMWGGRDERERRKLRTARRKLAR